MIRFATSCYYRKFQRKTCSMQIKLFAYVIMHSIAFHIKFCTLSIKIFGDNIFLVLVKLSPLGFKLQPKHRWTFLLKIAICKNLIMLILYLLLFVYFLNIWINVNRMFYDLNFFFGLGRKEKTKKVAKGDKCKMNDIFILFFNFFCSDVT